MKTLGLIGGTGPESTIEYYRLIIEAYRERRDGNYPPVIINSVNLKLLLALMSANKLAEVAQLLTAAIKQVARAGADFAAFTANTPHIVFDEVQRRSSIPLISIVETTCEKIQALGLKKVGLFGTRFTMQAKFYPEVFSRADITLVAPNEEEQNYIHDKYMNELLNNKFLPETRARLLAIADDLKLRDAIEALILGGTELPLLLRDEEHNGIPFARHDKDSCRAVGEGTPELIQYSELSALNCSKVRIRPSLHNRKPKALDNLARRNTPG